MLRWIGDEGLPDSGHVQVLRYRLCRDAHRILLHPGGSAMDGTPVAVVVAVHFHVHFQPTHCCLTATLTWNPRGLTNQMALASHSPSWRWLASVKSNLDTSMGTSFAISSSEMCRPMQVRDPRPNYTIAARFSLAQKISTQNGETNEMEPLLEDGTAA